MKKGILIGILFCLCVSATPAFKFWQDILSKPEQAWVELYGPGPASQLAYNCWRNKQLLDGQGKVIAFMKKEIDRLSDPNEVKKR